MPELIVINLKKKEAIDQFFKNHVRKGKEGFENRGSVSKKLNITRDALLKTLKKLDSGQVTKVKRDTWLLWEKLIADYLDEGEFIVPIDKTDLDVEGDNLNIAELKSELQKYKDKYAESCVSIKQANDGFLIWKKTAMKCMRTLKKVEGVILSHNNNDEAVDISNRCSEIVRTSRKALNSYSDIITGLKNKIKAITINVEQEEKESEFHDLFVRRIKNCKRQLKDIEKLIESWDESIPVAFMNTDDYDLDILRADLKGSERMVKELIDQVKSQIDQITYVVEE